MRTTAEKIVTALIAVAVIGLLVTGAFILRTDQQVRATAYPGPGWTDINYDIERLPIDGGWLYRDRTRGRFVFVPGAPV